MSERYTIKPPTIIIALIIGLCILTTGAVPGYQLNVTKLEIFLIILGFWLGLCALNKKILKIYCVCVLSAVLFMAVELLIYPESMKAVFRLICLYVSMIGVASYAFKKNINIMRVFYWEMLLLEIVSLGMYFTINVAQINLPHTTFTNSFLPTYYDYFHIFYDRVDMGVDSLQILTLRRNFSIFIEPGMFAVLIIFQMMIYLFVFKRRKKWHFFIILLALITTVSTTGLVLAFILIMYDIFHQVGRKKDLKLIVGVIGVLLCIMFTSSLLNIKADNHIFSFLARMTDLTQGFGLFLQKPIFGWGYNNQEVYQTLVSIDIFNSYRSNSNGIISILFQMGILGSAIFYTPVIIMWKKCIHNKKTEYLLFVFVVFVCIMSEPILTQSTGLLLLSMLIIQETMIDIEGDKILRSSNVF